MRIQRSHLAGAVVLGLFLLPRPADAAPLGDIIAKRAAQQTGNDLGVIDVVLPDSVRSLDVADADVRVTFRAAPRPGAVSVLVELDGKKPLRVWARVRYGKVQSVLVARRALTKGEAIKPGDLVRERRAVGRSRGWAMSPQALEGKRVLASAAAGGLIDESVLEPPAPVARGTALTVIVSRGRLRVSTTGTLERQARPGETALVRLKTHRRLISARLVDRQTAVIESTRGARR